MALVFQYGSNMSVARLNSPERLAGDARVVGIARTAELFDLAFSVWSKSNECAAANLTKNSTGRSVYGVLYEVPDFLLSRDAAKAKNRRSLDAIEGEGTNYVRAMIDVIADDNATVRALTYLVKCPKADLKTSAAYVSHILAGLREHGMPVEYWQYVRAKILENNADLKDELSEPTPGV